jgi:hypothetical protein
MSQNKRLACLIGGMLCVAVASTLGGCASAPPSMASSADNATMAQSIGDARNSTQEEPDLWHLVRNVAVDLYDAGLLFNPFLEGPIRIQLTGGR